MRLGGVEVVKRIDLSLPSRGVVALVGSNGAGKSTLLDALSGFVAHSGRVVEIESGRRLGRADLTRRSARLHQASVLPDGISLAEFLSVAETPERAKCALGGPWGTVFGPIGENVARTYKCLKDAIGEVEVARDLGALSLGQRRLVALAGILLCKKKMLLLDEPCAGLSELATEVALAMILGEAEKRPVLLAEHNLELAIRVSTRVVVLAGGRVVLDTLSSKLMVHDLLKFFG